MFETPWMKYNDDRGNFTSTWEYSPYDLNKNDRYIPNIFCFDGVNKYYKIEKTDIVRLVFDEKKYSNTPRVWASYLKYAGELAVLKWLCNNGYDEIKRADSLYVKRGKIAITLADLRLSWWAEIKK